MPPASAAARYTVPCSRGRPGWGALARSRRIWRAPLVEVVVRQQPLGADEHRVGIGDMGLDVRHAKLGRLDLEVLDVGAVRIEFFEIEPVENAQRDQSREALTVRRQFVDAIALEIHPERGDPFGRMRAKIVERQGPAVALRSGGDRLGEGAAIEGFALRRRDLFEGRRLFRTAENLAGTRRAPARHENLRKRAMAPQRLDLIAPLGGDDWRDREAVARVTDGGIEQSLEGQAAKPAM